MYRSGVLCGVRWWQVAELVIPMLVVVHLLCRKDLACVGSAHDEDVVEDLASDGVVTPVMCRRLVSCSRNASACRRVPSAVSMWKKSAAMMPVAWAVRNSRQVGPLRRGTGLMSAAFKISQIVDAPMR